MSARDIQSAYQRSLTTVPGGTAKVVKDVEAGHTILNSAGETLSANEIPELVKIFKAEIANPKTDRAVASWMREQLDTIDQLEAFAPQVNAIVDREAVEHAKMIKAMMVEGRSTFSLTAQSASRNGQQVPAEMANVPEATKKILNKAMAAGATFVDARAIEVGELGVDHGSISPKGKFQRYPQWRPLDDIFAVSATLQADATQLPKQFNRYDGLDPRMTILNGAVAEKLVGTPQEFNVEFPEGDGFRLDRVKRTWGEHGLRDRDPDAIVEEYDEKQHPDHLAWTEGDGPFASNAMIWGDGSLHLLRAPRRTYVDDKISMGGGILTTGSLGRGYPGWFWGHVHGAIQNLPKDPNDANSAKVPTFVVTYVGLAGFLCADIADGKIKLPDSVALLRSQGLRCADGLKVTFENPAHGANIWINPDTGLMEKKPTT